MIYLGKFKAGDTVKYRGNFHNDTGTLENPTSPEAQIEKPDASFTALTAPAIINAKTGHYGGSIDTTGFALGQHLIRMAGTVATAKTVATEFSFIIVGNVEKDVYDIAAHADYGNAKLVRSTTPANTLDVSTTGEAGLDFNNIKDAADAKTLTNITVPVVTAVTNDVGITQAGADKVWTSTTRTLTSFGTLVADIWAYSSRTLTAFSTALALSVWDVLEAAIATASSIGSKVKTNLDATISSRSSHSAADVWAVGTRALTDKVGFYIAGAKTTLDALNDITAASVWAVATRTITGGVIDTNSDKTGYRLSATGVDDICDEVMEGTLTWRQITRICLSALGGKSSGGGSPTLAFRDNADAKNRISATVDANGNRTAVTLDGA